MEIEEMKTKITELLEKKQYTNLRTLLSNINKADITVLLQELEIEDILKVFRLLPKDDAADVFAYLEPEFQEELINLFTDKELKEVIDELFMDDTVDLIEEMPANVVKRILRHVPVGERKEINEFLNYPQESAGSMMTNEFVDLKENMTVADALDRIKKIGLDRETIYTCYVLTMSRKLIGIITAKDLLLSDRDVYIKDIMKTNIISVTTVEDQENVAAMFNKYDIIALPVVDKENRLVGIITIDDAIDVIEEETTEDFELMTGLTPAEDSYFRTSVFTHSKNRVIWLFILMFSATITGLIITRYENAIASIPLLVAFIPMLMSTAGNCGAQASTLIIRGMAVEEIKTKDYFKVIWKELRVSLLVGLILSIANGIRIVIQYNDKTLAIVIGITMLTTVVLAKALRKLTSNTCKKTKTRPSNNGRTINYNNSRYTCSSYLF